MAVPARTKRVCLDVDENSNYRLWMELSEAELGVTGQQEMVHSFTTLTVEPGWTYFCLVVKELFDNTYVTLYIGDENYVEGGDPLNPNPLT